jgi:zinc transport system ATP-binding protein
VDPVVSLRDVSVTIGGRSILSAISFDVAPATIHVVAGPPGSGKSTLLRTVRGELPHRGTIVRSWQRGGTIGFVPQTFAGYAVRAATVDEFLARTRQRRPVWLGIAPETRKRIAVLLEHIGLAGSGSTPISELTGSELRRLQIAHALDPLPEMLLLDEPAAGFDAASANWLDDVLLTVKKAHGVTVLMASHDPAQARHIADRITVVAGRGLV